MGSISEAENAIGQIIETATTIIDKSWTRTTERRATLKNAYVELRYTTPRRARRPGSARSTQSSPWRRNTRFMWGVDGDEVFAGVTFAEDGPLAVDVTIRPGSRSTPNPNGGLIASIQQRWLWKVCKLEDVARVPADGQAAHVAKFVGQTFNELLRSAFRTT